MKDYGLERCVECGSCTDACPSARHGGIVPDMAVQSILKGEPVSDIWKCLQCHRCSSACPQDIDIAGAICSLRNESSMKGDVPERFRRTGHQMSETLKVFPIAGRTELQRTELGLSNDRMDQEEIGRVRFLLKEAGFDYE